MKKYNVSFWLSGRQIKTVITANGYWEAEAMIKAQYPGATNININESR